MMSKRMHRPQDGVAKSEDQYVISDRGYGKDFVKLLHVTRNGTKHGIQEYEVGTHLKLATDIDYLDGNNRDIIATDSQKNTIYLLAKKHGVTTPEEFGVLLCNHFLRTYSHVVEATATVEQYPWQRMKIGNREHNHAFLFTPTAVRHCVVGQKRNEPPTVQSSLKDLRVLKTTQSSFTGFVNDEYRSLPDAYDRIFSTVVTSTWEYSKIDGVDFDKSWDTVKECILKNFAGCPDKGVYSPSVQNTLYLAEKEVLNNIPEIRSIQMQMPNKHYFNVDLSKFPRSVVASGENNEVFLPVDKPSGTIYAQLDRRVLNSKL